MKIISTTLAGFIDYIVGLTLLLPYIVGYHVVSTDSLLLTAIGSFILLNSIHTDYEFSPVKLIPMRLHMALNIIAGLALIASPFVLTYEHYRWWPFFLGIVYVAVTLMTSPVPYILHRSDAPSPLGRI